MTTKASSNASAATPRPWRFEAWDDGPEGTGAFIHGGNPEQLVADVGPEERRFPGEAEANARLIVQAVNAHDDLIAALEALASRFEAFVSLAASTPAPSGCHDFYRMLVDVRQGGAASVREARAAIAKARGVAS